MPSIKFAIATNKEFAPVTIEKCIQSLLDSGVPADDIYILEGGYAYSSKVYNMFPFNKREGGVHHYRIVEDAMDYNAFIGVLFWNLEADYWFMLHDTCWVGKGFYEAVKGLKIDSPVMALSKEGFSMNIGLYSYKYIKANEFFIDSFAHWKDKGELKKHMVGTEDALLNTYKAKSHMCIDPPEVTGPTDLYGNGVQRIVVYYKEIDFYKSKANWQPKEQYELSL